MAKWISVEDALPVIKFPYGIEVIDSPEDMTIVIAKKGSDVFPVQVYYDGMYDNMFEPCEKYVLDDTLFFCDLAGEETITGVTHWQPLPDAEDECQP